MSAQKTVLITGASSGIGEALCHKYASHGFQVFACGRNQEKLAALASQYQNVSPLVFDVNNTEQIVTAASHVKQLDILILNAGDCRYIDDAKNFDGQLFSDIIATNLQSLGWLLQYFLSKVNTGGQLVFISSSATILPFARSEAYGASKAGVDYLANSLRIDLNKHQIAVTLVHPGFIKTPLTDKNTFAMPFLLTSEQAAERIVSGVTARKNYLCFPKRLIFTLRFFSFLPAFIWRSLMLRSINS